MHRATQLARSSINAGGHAVGAVIVRGARVIGEGVTTVARDRDSTCHAEINAIRQAAKKVGSRFLRNCYLYTTYELCPMCTYAAMGESQRHCIWSKPRRQH